MSFQNQITNEGYYSAQNYLESVQMLFPLSVELFKLMNDLNLLSQIKSNNGKEDKFSMNLLLDSIQQDILRLVMYNLYKILCHHKIFTNMLKDHDQSVESEADNIPLAIQILFLFIKSYTIILSLMRRNAILKFYLVMSIEIIKIIDESNRNIQIQIYASMTKILNLQSFDYSILILNFIKEKKLQYLHNRFYLDIDFCVQWYKKNNDVFQIKTQYASIKLSKNNKSKDLKLLNQKLVLRVTLVLLQKLKIYKLKNLDQNLSQVDSRLKKNIIIQQIFSMNYIIPKQGLIQKQEAIQQSAKSQTSTCNSDRDNQEKNTHIMDYQEFQMWQRENSWQLMHNQKLKNQLCKNFLRDGYCPYNEKCQFAHGIQQLRQKQDYNKKYKTKLCNSFNSNNYCIYGQRCNFLHESKPRNSKEQQKWKKIHKYYRCLLIESRNKSILFPNAIIQQNFQY